MNMPCALRVRSAEVFGLGSARSVEPNKVILLSHRLLMEFALRAQRAWARCRYYGSRLYYQPSEGLKLNARLLKAKFVQPLLLIDTDACGETL